MIRLKHTHLNDEKINNKGIHQKSQFHQSYRNWNPKRPQLEIDIFIPSLKLGFEFNGSHWHSLKPKGYHKEKTLLALENGIKLIHISSQIWMSNPERVKRMIGNRII